MIFIYIQQNDIWYQDHLEDNVILNTQLFSYIIINLCLKFKYLRFASLGPLLFRHTDRKQTYMLFRLPRGNSHPRFELRPGFFFAQRSYCKAGQENPATKSHPQVLPEAYYILRENAIKYNKVSFFYFSSANKVMQEGQP